MKSQLHSTVPENDTNVAIWNRYYTGLKDAYLFPNEYVVRSFLGSYPHLAMKRDYKGAKICDVSCGDGRNITLLSKLGAEIYGTEISEEVCAVTRQKLAAHHVTDFDIRVGFNDSLPFDDHFFDYLLSWNACYYMQNEHADFARHVAEFARILKPGGYLVASVPSTACFSLQGAVPLTDGKVRIQTDSKWDLLNGSIYQTFESPKAIEALFGQEFENFSHCRLQDDCFGLALDYYIFVCQKR